MKLTDIGQSTLDLKQSGEARLQEICERFGLANATYAHIDTSQQIVHGCTTFPSGWVTHYTKNNLVASDPLIRFGVSTIAPMYWAIFASQPEYAPLFEAAKQFNVGCQGISIPTISPFGDRGLFTVTSNLTAEQWQLAMQSKLTELRHEAQILQMLATGLSPSVISTQAGYSSGKVGIVTNSIMTKFKSTTVEQAVGKAVSIGTLRWTDFFANPVIEVVDRDLGVLVGGIVHWTGQMNEIIAFEKGRVVRSLDSIEQVQCAELSAKYHLPIDDLKEAFGRDGSGKIWVRFL